MPIYQRNDDIIQSFHSQPFFVFCFPNDLKQKKIWQFLLFTAFYNIVSYSSLLRKSLSWATQSLALSVNRLWPCLVESNKLVFSDFFLGFPLLFSSKYIHHITFNKCHAILQSLSTGNTFCLHASNDVFIPLAFVD